MGDLHTDASVAASSVPGALAGIQADSESPKADEYVGIINLQVMKPIKDLLWESDADKDKELSDWIDRNYFFPPLQPHEEGRGIRSTFDFRQLYDAYRRARQLSNNTVGEKWPFFTNHWKEMLHVTVKRTVKAADDQEGHTSDGQPKGSPEQQATIQQAKMMSEVIQTATSLADEPQIGPDTASENPAPASDSITSNDSSSLLTAAHSNPVITNLDSRPSSTGRNKRKIDERDGQNKKTKPNSRGGGRGRRRGRGRGGRRVSTTQQLEEDEADSELPSANSVPVDLSPTSPGESLNGRRKSARLAVSPTPTQATPAKTNDFEKNIAAEGSKNRDVNQRPESIVTASTKTEGAGEATTTGMANGKATSEFPITPHKFRKGKGSTFLGQNTEETDSNFALAAIRRSNTSQLPPPCAGEQAPHTAIESADPSDHQSISLAPATDQAVDENSNAHNIEFFARVYMPTRTMEIQLPNSSFSGDLDLVKRYAAWKHQEVDIDLTFDQFVRVYGFAKQG